MRRRRRITWGTAAVAAYALLIPLQPVFTMPDGSPLRFAAADAVAPLVVLIALARPRRRLPGGPGLLAVAVPLLALFATLWAARDRSLSHYALGKTAGLVYLVGVALCAARCLDAGGETRVLRALAAGGVWSAALGLVAFAASFAGLHTPLVSSGRLCSTMIGDPNIYCSLLAVSLVVLAGDAGLARRTRAGAIVVVGLAVLATGSRSGLVGTLAGLAVVELLRSRDMIGAALRALYVASVGVLVAALALLTDTGANAARVLWEHVWRTWTVESRFDLYARAWTQFSDHPLLGLGIGGFKDLNDWDFALTGEGGHLAVHDTYLWALVDLGLAGGVLVAALVAAGIWRAGRAARRRPPPAGAATITAGLATLALFDLFVDGFYQRHFWLLLACALALPGVRAARAAPDAVRRLVWTTS